MYSQDEVKFSGPCADDARRFLSISFETFKQKLRLAPSSINIEVDPVFFWHNQISSAATIKEIEDADKCREQQHVGTGIAVEPNKAPMEEEKEVRTFLLKEGNAEIKFARHSNA